MFPNAHHADALAAQDPTDDPIALTILPDLQGPEFRVLLRRFETPRAAVPETPIDKDSDTPFLEVKIRPADDSPRVQRPAPQMRASKESREPTLGTPITASTYRGHHR
jgi:hypothetical protein